jgi:hypothetical protein
MPTKRKAKTKAQRAAAKDRAAWQATGKAIETSFASKAKSTLHGTPAGNRSRRWQVLESERQTALGDLNW